MRCLLVVSGESFRNGGQGTRGRSDSPDSVDRQKLASYSHLRVINFLKAKFDIDTDIFINTYKFTPECDELLLKIYGPKVIYTNFRTTPSSSCEDFMGQTNRFVSELDLSPYEFILFIRIDLYIKEYFLSKFKKIDNKIRYGLLDYGTLGILHDIVYMPKCYFNLINVDMLSNFRNPHNGADYVSRVIGRQSIDHFINSYHSLSTNLNWNPIFTNVDRPESLNHECRGQRYIDYKKVFVENDDEYDHLIGTDTIEDNLRLLREEKFNMTFEQPNFFLIGNSHIDQFKSFENYSLYPIQKIHGAGASIRGLMNPTSTTGLNQVVNKSDNSPINYLLFHLGQVDIEFGYYYKSALANKKLDIESFIADTVKIYTKFLQQRKGTVIVIGVSPTAIKDTRHIFYVNFKDSVCHITNKLEEVGELLEERTYESLEHIYNDSVELRNRALFSMNEALKTMCIVNGWIFIDMMPILNDNGLLAERFQYEHLDHHIKPSEELGKYLSDRLNDIILNYSKPQTTIK